MSPAQDPRSGCPVVFALDIFGDRWTLLVIRDMALRGFTTYSELLAAEESISTNILADRLKRLETAGVITKRRDPDHGAKFHYELSQAGLDLIPVLIAMMRWSCKHDANSPVSAGLKRRIAREPDAMAKEFVKKAKARRMGR